MRARSAVHTLTLSSALGLAATLLLAAPAFSEAGLSDPATSENGRYSMTPAPGGGFLRLDTRTGAVALCKVENGAARCAAAAEERTALNDEIDRLARQNEALKGGATGSRPSANVPSAQEFDRALDFAEKFMRRMIRLMREDDPAKDRT